MPCPLCLALCAACIVAQVAGAQPPTPASPGLELRQAVELMGNFDDRGAALVLRRLLGEQTPDPIAAQAHVYLALIAMNAGDIQTAKREMTAAVQRDALTELPPRVSPKAHILFAQVQRESEGALTRRPGPRPEAPPPVVVREAAPIEASPFSPFGTPGTGPNERGSRLPSYLCGAGALATLGGGLLFGALQGGALSQAQALSTAAAAKPFASQYSNDGVAADVLFGVSAVAAVIAVTLYLGEGGPVAPADHSPGPP
ncbi:MAG: hypothetical protein ACYCWW_12440 [Deltaproteobacteria bacterium]